VEPFLTPDEYQVLGGAAQFQMAGRPGIAHVGAYQPATSYDPDDPVWAWENGWRKAEVIDADPSWIKVRYLGDFRCGKGRPSKGYRPGRVWPVICDYPEPIRKLEIEPEWLAKPDPRAVHSAALMLGYHNHRRYLKACHALGGCGMHE
jgi:hypothetical protein